MTAVLRYAQYLMPSGNSVYCYLDFCGSCKREIKHTLSQPQTPDDLLARNSIGDMEPDEGPNAFEWIKFCPWCGCQLDENWQRNRPVQNARFVDHYANPGTHAGDQHVFAGAIEGHILTSSDHSLCWCEPEVTPGITGCEVRHNVLPNPYEHP